MTKPDMKTVPAGTFKLGDFEIPELDQVNVAFGAGLEAYPSRDVLPKEYFSMSAPGCKIAEDLFYQGHSKSKRALKDGVDPGQFWVVVRSLLASWAPKHEVKIGTVGWLIDSYTEEKEQAE